MDKVYNKVIAIKDDALKYYASKKDASKKDVSENNVIKSNIIKANALEGLRVGMIAFLICFAVALLMALVLNIGYLDKLNQVINGSLSDDPKGSLGNVLITVSIIINVCVFNKGAILDNGGSLHLGLLLFIALPVIAFILADRRDNKNKHFNLEDMTIYSVSSVFFAILLYIYSIITKGELLGLAIDFTSFINVFMTSIIVMTIQFFIGFNYNKPLSPGIKMSRFLLRIFLFMGFVIGSIGMFVLFQRYVSSVAVVIVTILVLIPNVTIYLMFMFMGASIEFGEQLLTLMSKFGIDLSFTTLAFPFRIMLIVFFFVIVVMSVIRLGKEHYIKELFLFALSFSMISLIFAYCTTMNLGFVKNLLDVQFGISYVFAFIVPFSVILLAGFSLLAIRMIIREIKV